MNQFLGKRVCGTFGGDPFVNVTRPDASTMECPSGTTPCLATTIANETVCYPPDDLSSKCPITDIAIVDNTALSDYEDSGYTVRSFNDTTSLVFSKGVPQLPPTTIKVEQEPCMDALRQSSSPGEQFYRPEMMRSGCPTEKNTGLVYDPRFSVSGLYTSLYSVQTENSVTSMLEAESSYSTYVTTSQKENDKISSWNRPTLNYNLLCDAEGPTRAQALQQVVQTLEKDDNSVQKLMAWGACCLWFYLICGAGFYICPAKNKGIGTGLISSYAFMRLMYAIQAPVVGVKLSSAFDEIDENIDYVNELEKIANCMDETTFFDRGQIVSDFNEQKDKLWTCYIMWLVSLGMVVLEVVVLILGFIISKCKRAQQYRRNYDVQ